MPRAPSSIRAADLDDAKTCNNTATNNGNFNGTTSGLSLAPFMGNGTFNLSAALTSALLPRITPDNGTGFADNSTFNGTLDDGWSWQRFGRLYLRCALPGPSPSR